MKKLCVLTAVAAVLLVSCGGKPANDAPAASGSGAPAAAGSSKSTLQLVRERGHIVVGVNASNPGFAYLKEDGQYEGFEIDLAKALSVAVFGSPDKLEFRPLTSKERFVALQSGEIDVLIRTATANMTRDVELGLDFITPYFYDGQTFIVRGEANITKLEDLNGATIAVLTGTTTEMNLAAVFASRKLKYTPITFENLDEIKNAFVAGRADAVSFDKSRAMVFLEQYGNEGNFKGLDETISKEPLAIAVRHGDNNWKDICQWMLYALFFGEEHGINSTNIDSIKANTTNPEEKNFFGTSFGVGTMLGLDNGWTYQVIKQVGNYGELFDKHLGIPMKVTRGLNKPWTEGGLLYAHPFN